MIHELRIYTANPGKMPALQARFRDHTLALFEKHGMTNVGYWTNAIGGRSDELWYILGFTDLAHRERAWAAFAADPAWQAVRAESEKDGALVHHIENRILSPTNYSPLR
ncbi:MAG: NIPSNAP family protein [Dehalococcoidia bacterium]